MARYTIDNIEWPSVTEILGQLDKSSALIPWALNQAEKYILNQKPNESNLTQVVADAKVKYKEVSQESLDIGSEVHHAIENYIKYGKDKIGEIRDEVMNALIAFWDWEKDNHVEWIESESPIVSETIGYAGTLDAIAKVNGIVTCIDFKSSKAIYDEYIMQVCAYGYARRDMVGNYSINTGSGDEVRNYNPIEIDAVGILRLDKTTGMPEWKMIHDQKKIERTIDAFLALTKFYYLVKNRRLKNNPIVQEVNGDK